MHAVVGAGHSTVKGEYDEQQEGKRIQPVGGGLITIIPLHPMAVPERAFDYAESVLRGMIPDESELTAGVTIRPGKDYGFFTDTSLCVGCKACEAACEEWNALPIDDLGLTGMSYDNTETLGPNPSTTASQQDKGAENQR